MIGKNFNLLAQEIETLITKAEEKTILEFVPVLYDGNPLKLNQSQRRFFSLFSGILCLFIYLTWNEFYQKKILDLTLISGVFLTACILSFFISGFQGVFKLLFMKTLEKKIIHSLAEKLFLKYHVHRTAQGTGILILMIPEIHSVYILADQPIYSKFSDLIHQLSQKLMESFSTQNLSHELSRILDKLIQETEAEFGIQKNHSNPNELKNCLRIENS